MCDLQKETSQNLGNQRLSLCMLHYHNCKCLVTVASTSRPMLYWIWNIVRGRVTRHA